MLPSPWEGRGTGPLNKLRPYALRDRRGHDTVGDRHLSGFADDTSSDGSDVVRVLTSKVVRALEGADLGVRRKAHHHARNSQSGFHLVTKAEVSRSRLRFS